MIDPKELAESYTIKEVASCESARQLEVVCRAFIAGWNAAVEECAKVADGLYYEEAEHEDATVQIYNENVSGEIRELRTKE